METTMKKTLSKSARLTWLLLYRLSGGTMNTASYARMFGIHHANAANDERDIEPLIALLEETLPNVKELVTQAFTPEQLAQIPILETEVGDHSRVSLDLQIDHKTGEISWGPFAQEIFDRAGENVGVLFNKAGTMTKRRKTPELA